LGTGASLRKVEEYLGRSLEDWEKAEFEDSGFYFGSRGFKSGGSGRSSRYGGVRHSDYGRYNRY